MIRTRLQNLASLALHQANSTDVAEEASELLSSVIASGKKILIAGNGGSAAQAQHFAGELTGRFQFDRAPLASLALSADSVALTCIGNDYGYAEIFARQVRAVGTMGDALICLSTSGQSPNIIRATEVATDMGIAVVAITGRHGLGGSYRFSPLVIRIDSDNTALIQEVTESYLHSFAERIECDAFPGRK